MTSIKDTFRRLFAPHEPIPTGVYPYQAPPDAPFPYRLHLRVDPDGSGILIVNASTVLHLNPTAAEYAYYLVKGNTSDEVASSITRRYHSVRREQVVADFSSLVERIQTMVQTPDLDPETYLDFERQTPYSGQLTAPYRLDCALTYRTSPGSASDAAPLDRVKRELSTDEWKKILDKAWDAGIPHIIFTGGEPTLREDLLELLAYCDLKGQVTGLLTDGLRLNDPTFLNDVIQPRVGLDHLMLIFQPERNESWEALKNLLAADLFVIVHLTITPENAQAAGEILNRLSQMGAKALSLSASSPDLQNTIQDLRNQAAQLSLPLVWDLPVPYSSTHPVALEISKHEEDNYVQGAGKAWLYVEPDGDVLPAQGINSVLGNFLTDPWEQIWAVAKA